MFNSFILHSKIFTNYTFFKEGNTVKLKPFIFNNTFNL
jgi:hypothetical protein